MEPLAQPYRALIPINKEQVRQAFDQYWEDDFNKILKALPEDVDKERLANDIDYKKEVERLVGPSKLYLEVLNKIANMHLNDVLVYENLEIVDFESENPTLFAMFYYIPKIELQEPINYEVDCLTKEDHDLIWQAKLENLRNEHKELYTPDDKIIPEDKPCYLQLSVRSYKDGVIYKNDWIQDEWVALEDLPYPIRKMLYGQEGEGIFKVTYRTKHGDPIDANVIVKGIQIEETLSDDELAKKEGFTSFAEMKEAFFKNIEVMAEMEKLSHMCDVLLAKMLTTAKIEPIPYVWLETTSKKMAEQYIIDMGSVDTAIKKLGASNENELNRFFIAQAHRDILKKITFSEYARKFNLKNENEILDHLSKNVKWTNQNEVETS